MKTTTDIYFAAALLSLGAKLEKTDREDPRHMVFSFSTPKVQKFESQFLPGSISVGGTQSIAMVDKLDLEKLENEWVNKTLTVNAFEFAEALKRMKSIVHSR